MVTFTVNDVDSGALVGTVRCKSLSPDYEELNGAISTLYGNDKFWLDSMQQGGVTKKRLSAMLAVGDDRTDIFVEGTLMPNNEKVRLILKPNCYRINIGKNAYSIFGEPHKAYLEKITKAHFISNPYGKPFSSASQMLTYCQKYENVLRYMATNNGYHFSISTEGTPADVKTAGAKLNELNALFADINNTEEPKAADTTTVMNTPKEEAVSRLKSMHVMYSVITAFKSGHLMQSEAGGILYDLDDNAKLAVNMVTDEYGGTPYHVIRTGSLYSVLYVSAHKEEWAQEHYDPASGSISAYVYNAEDPDFSEFGDICVQPTNGGLVRTN